jgi:hypothetical protein
MTYARSPKTDKFDPSAEADAKGGRAPASKGEVAQRAANKASHSQRVAHGGRPASGAKK